MSFDSIRKHPVRAVCLTLTLVLVASLAWPVPDVGVSLGHVTSTRVTDREGRLLRDIRPDGRGAPVSLDDIPPEAVEALIAVEDQRFYRHPGVDPLAVMRAARTNLQSGRIVSGASTITMQVADAMRATPSRGWVDKIRDAHLAVRLELRMSKPEILEAWLNLVPFGNHTHGFEAAAELYFGKSARDLTPAEATFLVGLPQRPAAYNPFRHVEAARQRHGRVLNALERGGILTPEERARISSLPIDIRPRESVFRAPHFVEWITADAESGGAARSTTEIRTTLDLDLQQAVEGEIDRQLRMLDGTRAGNAAAVVLDNETGAVLAWAGSADFWNDRISGQNDGVRMRRQPGSALKPFMYAMVLASARYTPASILPDIELNVLEAGGAFTPVNYDETYHGPVPLREALASSFNVPAVRLVLEFGPERLLQALHRAGFSSLDHPAEFYGVGLTLGNGEVQLLELARAYSGLARGGRLPRIRGVDWARSTRGDTLRAVGAAVRGESRRGTAGPASPDMGISPQVAYLITDILSDPAARVPGFGRGGPLELPFPTAVKTGTSKDYRDNWAVGYTPAHTVAVWVGNFDGTPMQQVSGVSGAGPILNGVFQRLGSGGEFIRPPGIEEAEISPASGLLAGPDTPVRRRSLFLAGTMPTDTCDVYRRVPVDIRSGLRAGADTPAEFVRERLYTVYPPMYNDWMRDAGIAVPPPIPEDATDAPLAAATPTPVEANVIRPSVDYPETGTVFQMDPVLRAEFQRVHPRATLPEDVKSAFWTVSGERLPGAFEAASWKLRPGRHRFVAHGRTGDGRSVESLPAEIVVLESISRRQPASE